MTPEKQLDAGLETLGLSTDGDLAERLLAFLADLEKWNKVYNLTAIRNRGDMVLQHILDSLSVASYIEADAFVDVGTGGGFPGVPLAMNYPEKKVVLLDSNVKKTRFLQQMVINHGLRNCEVMHTRAESCSRTFGAVVCRAFASLPDIVSFAGHMVEPGGKLMAMKGQLSDEVEQVDGPFTVNDVIPLQVPGLNAQRHLVVLVHSDET